MNYYNEHDPKAAAWLRELIKAKLIPDGHVDERDIQQVRAGDVAAFQQCHFFAGIGGWSRALAIAQWPADRKIWSGSCPCQPFSTAGKLLGESDPRHLWPDFRRLIAECHPPEVVGEQVASKAGRLWLAGVRTDLEALGYAVGAADLCAAGFGAPHLRQRLFWVAKSKCDAREPWWITDQSTESAGANPAGPSGESGRPSTSGGLADTTPERLSIGHAELHSGAREAEPHDAATNGGMGHTNGPGSQGQRRERGLREGGGEVQVGRNSQLERLGDAERAEEARLGRLGIQVEPEQKTGRSRNANPWSEHELIGCADGKARRVKPGLQCLAHGVPARVVRLRGYGNAIVPLAAAEFIQAYLETNL